MFGTRAAAAVLATASVGLVLAAEAAAAPPLQSLRHWGVVTAHSFDAGRTGTRAVEARVRALRRVVRRAGPRLLHSDPATRSIEVALSREALDRRLARAPFQLRAGARYFFFLAYQAELERLAEQAGLDFAPTGRLTAPRGRLTPERLRALQAADTDGDGVIDEVDGDQDGDGLADSADPSDLGWGIPDRFLARPASGPAEGAPGYCVYATERLPRPVSVSASRSWAARASRRGCSAPRPSRIDSLVHIASIATRASVASASQARTRRVRYLPLRKLGFRASGARLDGALLTLKVRAKRTLKARFEVLVGTRVVLKTRKAVKVRKGNRTLRVRFPKSVELQGAKLRITLIAGKRRARGTLALKITPSPARPAPQPGGPQLGAPLPAPRCDVDSDRDTIPDCEEVEGFDWKFFTPSLNCRNIGGAVTPVIQCGDEKRKRVRSDPNSANTDNDAVTVGGRRFELTDAEEWELALQGGISDPSRADSDTDGVPDVEERERWGSNPAHPDSDSDGVARDGAGLPGLHPTLYDRGEIDGGSPPGSRVVTSPTASDTDGDGSSDTEEVLGGSSTNARVADVPEFAVFPAPNTTFSIAIGQGTTADVELTNSQTLGEAREQSDERADSTTNGERTQISASLEYEFPAGVKASVSTEHEWSSSKTKAHTTKFSNQERSEAQKAYAEKLSTNTDATGSIAADFVLLNKRDDRPLTVKNLSVLASFVCLAGDQASGNTDCGEQGKRAPLATLTPQGVENAFTLEANASRTIRFAASSVDAKKLRAIAANPSNLSFSPAEGDIHESSTGPNLQDSIGKSIPQSTGGITIDDGRGHVVDLSIATAVDHEWGKPDPSQATRMKLADALAVAGVTLKTAPTPDGHEGIKQIAVPGTAIDRTTLPANRETGQVQGAWAVFAHFDRFGNPIPDPANVDQLELTIFDQFVLAYIADNDADGLFDREEREVGTSDDDPDTDGDGLRAPCPLGAACPRGTGGDNHYDSDYFEALVGWDAGPVTKIGGSVVPKFHVQSDPATCDGDGDGSNDGPGTCKDGVTTGSTGDNHERARSTDPVDPDTDDDNPPNAEDLDDFSDPQPLVGKTPPPPPPPPDQTQAFVPSNQLVCGGSFDVAKDACQLGAGQTVETPDIKLCGPPENPGTGACAGTTGYYRAQWEMLHGNPGCGTCRMGTFEIANGSTLMLRASWDEEEFDMAVSPTARRELFFAATRPLDNLRLRYLNRLGGATVARVRIAKVTEAEFLNQKSNKYLTAIAIPAKLLVPGATGDEASLPIPGSGSQQVASGPDLSLPGGAFGGFRGYIARFGLRMSGTSINQALQIGVSTGAGPPGGSEPVVTDPTQFFQNDSTTYLGAGGDRYPIVQGTVRPADLQSAGPGSQAYVKMMFEAGDPGFEHISLPVRAYAGAPATVLTNVVVEPIGDSVIEYAGWLNLQGTVRDTPDTRWLATSFLPFDFNAFRFFRNANLQSDSTAVLSGNPGSADQAETSMYKDSDKSYPLNNSIPTYVANGSNPTYYKWGVVARRESMSSCDGDDKKYHLTDRYDSGGDLDSRLFAEYRLDAFGPTSSNPSDRKLMFAPRPLGNRDRSSLRIESYKCGNGIVPSIHVYAAMLMTRPQGQFTVGETFP